MGRLTAGPFFVIVRANRAGAGFGLPVPIDFSQRATYVSRLTP